MVVSSWRNTTTGKARPVADRNRDSFLPTIEPLEERIVLSNVHLEQWFIYILNRARSNPYAYQLERGLVVDISSVEAKPALAVNPQLQAAARFKASEMANYNYYAHQSAVTGLYANQVAENHGYDVPDWWGNGNNMESLDAYFSDPNKVLDRFIEDIGVNPPYHRYHLLGMNWFFADHREIGVGYSLNTQAQWDHYWAVYTGYQNYNSSYQATDKFLTGVVYNDTNVDGRYNAYEGLAGVTITAGNWSTITDTAGGWSIPYTGSGTSLVVTASGGPIVGTRSSTVTLSNQNIHIEFIAAKTYGIVDFNPASANQAPPADTTPPRVTQVAVRGSAWGSDVPSYAIPVGSGANQYANLPWNNINQIQVTFSENVQVSQANLKMSGSSTFQYGIAGFQYNSVTRTATWTMNQSIPGDQLAIRLDGTTANGLRDLSGNLLDGEWQNPTSLGDPSSKLFPSGNGTAGGDFLFRFNVLPGDVNQDGTVSTTDWAAIRSKLFTSVGQPGYSLLHDLNGNGQINATDWSIGRSLLFTTLPSGGPLPPAPFAPGDPTLPTNLGLAGRARAWEVALAESFAGLMEEAAGMSRQVREFRSGVPDAQGPGEFGSKEDGDSSSDRKGLVARADRGSREDRAIPTERADAVPRSTERPTEQSRPVSRRDRVQGDSKLLDPELIDEIMQDVE